MKLVRLCRHSLRRAACSAWLAAGVSPKIAQIWSSHEHPSVFLDVYQGLVAYDHSTAVNRWQSYVAAQLIE